MKKLSIISVFVLGIVALGCSDNRNPKRIYMPDMGPSRAFETYSSIDTLLHQGINYTRLPVPGTIKRGELIPFAIPKDKVGDSVNYVQSRSVQNPLPALNKAQMTEAERLYLVNCGICHGQKLDGNGPLYNGGNGPFAAAPRNLTSDPVVTTMPEGQMFYSITYGKGAMGAYGPQLSTTQRWMIIHFIKSKQAGGNGGGAAAGKDSTAAGSKDSTAAKANKI